MKEKIIKLEVEFKINYESNADLQEGIRIAKYHVLSGETHMSSITVKPLKAKRLNNF
tara:strand:+ start:1660 stop:1830 length:171 start_codon:yes stop_codon:yes gene_type:complete